jgi:hypothetical protein
MFDEFANLHQLRATHLGVCRLGSVACICVPFLTTPECTLCGMQIQDLGTRHPGPVAASRASPPFRHQLPQRPGRRTDVQYAPRPSSPHCAKPEISVCITIISSSSSSNHRYHTVYTIDDASTTEVDDGISVEWQTGGSTRPNNW